MVKLSLVRYPLLLLLLWIPLQSLCQDSSAPNQEWEEFAEQTQYQNADELQTSYNNLLLDAWTRDMEHQKLRISYQPESLRYHAWLMHKAWRLGLSSIDKENDTWQSFSLQTDSSGSSKMRLNLMSYRVGFGKGLITETGSSGSTLSKCRRDPRSKAENIEFSHGLQPHTTQPAPVTSDECDPDRGSA